MDTIENSPFTKIGYGGSRGGAKSHGGRLAMLSRRFNYHNTNGMVFRKTYIDLYENHILPLFMEYPKLRKFYNKSEKILSLPHNSKIFFRYAEHHDDIYAFFGKEYADIFIDEATDLEQDQIEFLSTCNRCTTNLSIVPKMFMSMNPGRVGHAYIKRIFITKDYRENENPDDYYFIQAYGWDNVEWVRKSLNDDRITVAEYYSWSDEKRFDYFIHKSSYGKKLSELPEKDRKAQLLGDWDVYEGQFFHMWNRKYHLLPRFTDLPPIPGSYKLIGGLDYGDTTALEVILQDKENFISVIAENVTRGVSPYERGNSIADTLIEHKLFNFDIMCDTDMVIDMSNYTGMEHTPFEIIQDILKQRMGDKAPMLRVVSKTTTDKRGYRAVSNEAIKDLLHYIIEDGKMKRPPRLRFCENCKYIIETLPELQYDKNAPEGLDFDEKIGEDHGFDGLKYAVLETYKKKEIKKPPVPGWFDEMMRSKKAGWKVGAG